MNRHRIARPLLHVLCRARSPLVRFNEYGHVPAGRLRLAIEWMIDRVETWEMQPDLDRMEAHAQRVEALARYVSFYAKSQNRED